MNRSIVYSAFVELCCICIDGVTRGKFTTQDWQGEEQRTPHYRGHSRKKRLPVNKGYEMGVLSAKHWWYVSDFCRELAKHPHRLACGDVFVTSVENLQNIDDVFVTSVKNLQNIPTGRLLVMCLWLLLRTCKTAAMCFWLLSVRICKTTPLVGLWWCVCDFCWELAKHRWCVCDFC